MSQAAASVDARVPTPGSVAEVLSQQALPDSGPEAEPDFKDQDEDSSSGKKQPDIKMEAPQESRRLTDQRCIQSLEHASLMKRVVQLTKGCKCENNDSCPVCKQLIALCCYHAKHCQENKCPVPFCLNLKHKLLRQRLQERLLQQRLRRLQRRLQQARMRQRMATPPHGA